jgi:hypothetical protein
MSYNYNVADDDVVDAAATTTNVATLGKSNLLHFFRGK